MFKLKEFDLHMKYKDNFVNFYMQIYQHKEETIR